MTPTCPCCGHTFKSALILGRYPRHGTVNGPCPGSGRHIEVPR